MKKIFLGLTVLISACATRGSKPINDNSANNKVSEESTSIKSFETTGPIMFLYSQIDKSSSDEYQEGNFYIYDVGKDTSQLIIKDEIISRSTAWITRENGIVMVSDQGIKLYSGHDIVYEYNFSNDKLLTGATYRKNENLIYFVLNNINANGLDLYCYNLNSNKVYLLRPNVLNSEGVNIETPNKNILISGDDIFIEDICNKLRKYNIKSGILSDIIYDRNVNCIGFKSVIYKTGILYLSYNNDTIFIKYYDVISDNIQLLFEQPTNQNDFLTSKIYMYDNSSSFVITIGNKYILYNGSSNVTLPLSTENEIVYISSTMIYYLTDKGEIETILY